MEHDCMDGKENIYLACSKKAPAYYCKHECPIGKNFPMATQESGLQGITVKILNSLDDDEIRGMKKNLLSIAADGEITVDEQEEFDRIVKTLEELKNAISGLRQMQI